MSLSWIPTSLPKIRPAPTIFSDSEIFFWWNHAMEGAVHCANRRTWPKNFSQQQSLFLFFSQKANLYAFCNKRKGQFLCYPIHGTATFKIKICICTSFSTIFFKKKSQLSEEVRTKSPFRNSSLIRMMINIRVTHLVCVMLWFDSPSFSLSKC